MKQAGPIAGQQGEKEDGEDENYGSDEGADGADELGDQQVDHGEQLVEEEEQQEQEQQRSKQRAAEWNKPVPKDMRRSWRDAVQDFKHLLETLVIRFSPARWAQFYELGKADPPFLGATMFAAAWLPTHANADPCYHAAGCEGLTPEGLELVKVAAANLGKSLLIAREMAEVGCAK